MVMLLLLVLLFSHVAIAAVVISAVTASVAAPNRFVAADFAVAAALAAWLFQLLLFPMLLLLFST
jgi:hypothetical protein